MGNTCGLKTELVPSAPEPEVFFFATGQISPARHRQIGLGYRGCKGAGLLFRVCLGGCIRELIFSGGTSTQRRCGCGEGDA